MDSYSGDPGPAATFPADVRRWDFQNKSANDQKMTPALPKVNI
jgi:hypothetical protein